MSDDGFILVKPRKKNRRVLRQKIPIHFDVQNTDDCHINRKTALRKIQKAIEEIASTDFLSAVLSTLYEGLNQIENATVNEIVCYGLGHIAECRGPCYQLALLLSLKKQFSASISVYDPIFYAVETDILKELGCEVLTVNEEGKHKISPSLTTLIFLPHCPKQLTNNFLWANWGPQLKNCILFSNSFAKVIEIDPERILKSTGEYILRICPYTTEFVLTNLGQYRNIFHASSIHIFPPNKLSSVSEKFWDSHKEPKYNIEDREFIVSKSSFPKWEIENIRDVAN